MKLPALSTIWASIAVFIAFSIWGGNYVVAKLTLEEIPPMSLAFLRFAFALVFLFPFVLAERKRLAIQTQDLPRLFGVGALMTTLGILFFYQGITRTTAIEASVLTMSVPVLSVIFSWIIFKEKIYTVNLIGIVVGLVGALIVLGFPRTLIGIGFDSEKLLGNILILLGSICWVLGSMLSKSLLKKYSTLDITVFMFLVGVLAFAIPAVNEYLIDPTWPAKITALGFIGLAYIVLGSSISAFFLFEWGLKKLGVVKTNVFQYIEPLIATTLAVFILSESFGMSFIIGSLLIGLGVYQGTIAKESHMHHKMHRH